jgi:hypothetical protein
VIAYGGPLFTWLFNREMDTGFVIREFEAAELVAKNYQLTLLKGRPVSPGRGPFQPITLPISWFLNLVPKSDLISANLPRALDLQRIATMTSSARESWTR